MSALTKELYFHRCIYLYSTCWNVFWLKYTNTQDGKESACNLGDPGSILRLGRSPGEGNGYPLQFSCLENSMDRGAWWVTVHGVTKSRTRLSYFPLTFMHWRRKWQPTPVFLPGESQGREPGGLPSMGSHSVERSGKYGQWGKIS